MSIFQSISARPCLEIWSPRRQFLDLQVDKSDLLPVVEANCIAIDDFDDCRRSLATNPSYFPKAGTATKRMSAADSKKR